MPDLMAGARVEREHLVRPGYVHDAVGNDRNSLQSEVLHVLAKVGSVRQELRPQRDGEGPFHAERAHVRLVDLRERAVAISVHIPVERRPLPRLRVENPREINAGVGTRPLDSRSLARGKRDDGAGRDPGQSAQKRNHVAQLVVARLHCRHVRRFFVRNGRDVIERHRMERACQILDGDVETAAAARESTQRSTIAHAHGSHAVTGRDARVWGQQRLANLIDGQLERDFGEIGSDRRTFALHQVAGRALSLAKEKLFAGRYITGHVAFCGHRVQRDDHRGESIERVGWKIEGGHPCGRNSITDHIPQALRGSRADRRIRGKPWTLVRAARIVSMASAAQLRVRLLDIRRSVLRPQYRAQDSRDQDGAALDHLGTMSSGMPRPGPPISAVRTYPSVIVKMPGNR